MSVGKQKEIRVTKEMYFKNLCLKILIKKSNAISKIKLMFFYLGVLPINIDGSC